MALVLPIEDLLKPVSQEHPCGVLDPVNEGQLGALEEAIKGRAAVTRFKDGETTVVREAQPPPWSLLEKAARGLFMGGRIPDLTREVGSEAEVEVKPVKHLRAALVLTLAGLELEGLAGFADGLALIARLLTEQWKDLHPVAAEDDPEEPFLARVNLLAPLSIAPQGPASGTGSVTASDSWRIQERLFQASLLNSKRHGNLSVRGGLSPWADSLKFALPPGEDCTAEHVREVRLAAAESVPQQQQVLRAAIAAAENIERAFAGVPGGIKPKLALLMGVLKGAAAVLDDTVSAEETTGVDAQSGKAAALPGGRATGPVSSREDAVRKLIEAAEYFRRHEPSSPIPLLVDRVRRLAGMNFLALVEELGLGDQALQEFRKLAGVRETPEKTEAAAPSSSG